MEKTNTRNHPTEAQIRANRENAKKSTGPRTPEGKAASSRNGLTHGLCAEKFIFPGEDSEEYLLLLQDLFHTFRPVGPAEEKLVTCIAAAQWRLDRAPSLEAGIYRERILQVAEADAADQRNYEWNKENAQLRNEPPPPAPAVHDPRDLLARAFDNDAIAPNSLARLVRYEGALERSIEKCLRLLKTYQAARQANEANPNTVADTPEDPVEATDFKEDVGQAPWPAEGPQARPFPPPNPVPNAPDAHPDPPR
jgi:hypothetical protein